MTKIVINVDSCKECPYFQTGNPWSSAEWDNCKDFLPMDTDNNSLTNLDMKKKFKKQVKNSSDNDEKLLLSNVIKTVCEMCGDKKELQSDNLCKECYDSLPS